MWEPRSLENAYKEHMIQTEGEVSAFSSLVSRAAHANQ